MHKFIFSLLLVLCAGFSFSQSYITRTAHVNVKSTNKVQNIVADNYQVACQLDAATGQFKIIMLIKSFEYKIGVMNRVMSSRDINITEFPKITYDGFVSEIQKIDLAKPGTYPVKFKGTLYIWDEKRVTDADGTLKVLPDGTIEGKTNFTITIEDFNMKKIDNLMKQKLPSSLNLQTSTLGISKSIEVKAEAILKN
jgi:hypothetical protein